MSRDQQRQSRQDRSQLRRHLRELDEARDESLLALGSLALDMHRRDRFDAGLLEAKAAEVEAVEEEVGLVRRGLDEKLSLVQLEEIARTSE